MNETFIHHLERATQIVATWPKWKQRLLGSKPMTTLESYDVWQIVRSLPVPVQELLRQNSHVMLAGGFIRDVIAGEKSND